MPPSYPPTPSPPPRPPPPPAIDAPVVSANTEDRVDVRHIFPRHEFIREPSEYADCVRYVVLLAVRPSERRQLVAQYVDPLLPRLTVLLRKIHHAALGSDYRGLRANQLIFSA